MYTGAEFLYMYAGDSAFFTVPYKIIPEIYSLLLYFSSAGQRQLSSFQDTWINFPF